MTHNAGMCAGFSSGASQGSAPSPPPLGNQGVSPLGSVPPLGGGGSGEMYDAAEGAALAACYTAAQVMSSVGAAAGSHTGAPVG